MEPTENKRRKGFSVKKADIILGVSVITAAIILLAARSFFQKDGALVVVEKDGRAYGAFPLSKNQEIWIGTGNRIRIQDHKVWMIFSDCPDHLCEHQGIIQTEGEMIVCLPHRVVVQVEEDKESQEEQPDVIVS
ncbi:NusG domain II-containing protein [bacterium 1XD42-54]|nr:NusG domain II-containing protein [bacterium 1XD42-54]